MVPAMTTLFRLLVTLIVLGALGFGGMIALVTFVDPKPRDMSYSIPSDRFNRDATTPR